MYLFILPSYVGFILAMSLDALRKMNVRWRYLQCFVVTRGSSPKLMSESMKVVSWGQFDSDHPIVTSVLSKVIQASEFILSSGKQRLVTEEFIFLLWEVQPRNSCFVFWEVQSCNRGIPILILWEVLSFNREFLLSRGKYRLVTDEFGSRLIVRRCLVRDLVW